MERHSVARLVGAPPGYVGYEDAGQLTETVRRRPFSIVVFDEIEKAHPETFNMLLQIMEEGTLSDAKGRKVDFRNAILVLTSNIGAELIKQQGGMGFAIPQDEEEDAQHDYEEMRDKLIEELKRTFRPEFINRVDSVIVFHALSKENIAQIVNLELNKVRERLTECNAELTVTDAAKALLAEQGYSDEYGARPLKRVIQNQVEDALSDAILECRFGEGDRIIVDAVEDEIVLRKQPETSEELVPA
jgi:ATP-dependent Clp protease ATP-binding subunit ClpC